MCSFVRSFELFLQGKFPNNFILSGLTRIYEFLYNYFYINVHLLVLSECFILLNLGIYVLNGQSF